MGAASERRGFWRLSTSVALVGSRARKRQLNRDAEPVVVREREPELAVEPIQHRSGRGQTESHSASSATSLSDRRAAEPGPNAVWESQDRVVEKDQDLLEISVYSDFSLAAISDRFADHVHDRASQSEWLGADPNRKLVFVLGVDRAAARARLEHIPVQDVVP